MRESLTRRFIEVARGWLATATHPKFGRLFKQCMYRPQVELLAYLRGNGFKTYIVSAGGADFMRAFVDEAYGIPREQVIGSSVKLRCDGRDNRVSLSKLSELNLFGDREAKALSIGLHIGRRPLLAFGNSDGDLPMMRYAKSGPGPQLALLLHHDDAERESAYDREFRLSPLSEALDKAQDYGISVVSMKRDWKVVFDGAAMTALVFADGSVHKPTVPTNFISLMRSSACSDRKICAKLIPKNASSAMPASAPTGRPSTRSLSSFAPPDAAAGTSTARR